MHPFCTCDKGVQFHCPSRTYSAIHFCTIFLILEHCDCRCRDFLKTHLSSSTLDNLMMEVQHRDCQRKTGFFFTMASLCSDRISHLPIAPASDDNRFVVLLHISTTVGYKNSKKCHGFHCGMRDKSSMFLSAVFKKPDFSM